MSRKKQAALAVPATLEGARARLVAEQVIDQIKAERDALIALYAVPNAGRFAALKAWWEAGGKDLAGKRRSAELAGAMLGIRLTTPKVKFARGTKVEAIVSWLGMVVGGKAFLRTKVELDKEAVIKAVRSQAPMAGPLSERGVTVDQTDEFFIDCTIGEAPTAAAAES